MAWKAPQWRDGQKRVEKRGTAAERGYDHRWRKARAVWLAEHPLCAACWAACRVVPATVVDHVVPHRGNQEVFWKDGNLQSLCEACHNAKTKRGE